MIVGMTIDFDNYMRNVRKFVKEFKENDYLFASKVYQFIRTC